MTHVPSVPQERNPRCISVTELPLRALLNRCAEYQRYVQNNPDRATTSNRDSPIKNACQLRIPENCRLVRARPARGERFGRKSGSRRRSLERQIPGTQRLQRRPAARQERPPEPESPERLARASETVNAAATIA